MPRTALPSLFAALLSAVACCGCEHQGGILPDSSFGPTRVRIHPTFTQVKDWTGDNKPDGIEVVVELLDDMDEPMRAPGKMIFELFTYRKDEPNPAGDRILNPWVGTLLTREEQAQHWSPALRAYTFQLAYPKVRVDQSYVLTVTFESAGGASRPGGGRLFDRVVLEPLHEKMGKRHGPPVIPDRISGSRG